MQQVILKMSKFKSFKYRQASFYARVMFLNNVTHIEHTIPI